MRLMRMRLPAGDGQMTTEIPMNRKLMPWAACMLALLAARPAYAWDDFGHAVVARIAWENMTPQARARAVAILRGAPQSSGLLRGFPAAGTLAPERQMDLFVTAALWPDDVRDEEHPGHRFARGDRHFVNLYWRQRADFSAPQPADRPEEGHLLRDLPALRTQLTGADRGEAAMALAWLAHLVADIHQPLHASARLTPHPDDRDGDGGGNDFRLGQTPPRSLHQLWDGIVTHTNRRRSGESREAYAARVAREITTRHPRRAFPAQMAVTDFRAWAREGLQTAQRDVYRAPLQRNRPISEAYRRQALAAAEPRIALAGYRLAALLNQALR